MFADYFTVGCRSKVRQRASVLHCYHTRLNQHTNCQDGYVVILVPRSDNVETKAIKTAYSSTAGTAYVTFEKARAPVANTLGKVGQGLQVILSNFNHERWMIICTSLSAQRLVVEECLKYALTSSSTLPVRV